MADANPKVQAMVARELKKNPSLTNEELRAKAEKIDKAVKELTGRQFHAQYALPVRRQMPGTKRGKKAAKGGRRRAAPKAAQSGQAAASHLEDAYQEKKSGLDASIDAAFHAAIAADSLSRLNKLFSWLDRETAALAKKG